jgi:hypothetical protein
MLALSLLIPLVFFGSVPDRFPGFFAILWPVISAEPRGSEYFPASAGRKLALAGLSPVRASTRNLRISLTSSVESSISKVSTAIYQIGFTSRSITAEIRLNIQRKIALSVCCARQIGINIVRSDLAHKFPGSRIEQRVQIIDRTGNPSTKAASRENKLPSDIVDFVILHRGKPALIFEGCSEVEKKLNPSQHESTNSQYIVLEEAGQAMRYDVTGAVKLQACVKWENGTVTYRNSAT